MAATQRRAHPLISALAFCNSDGASMNVRTFQLSTPGNPSGYFVGGEPDVHGRQIAELGAFKPGDLTPDKALQMATRVRNETGFRSDAHLGIWHNPEDGMSYADASRPYKDLDEATRLGRIRNEDAIWDNVNLRSIPTGNKNRK